MKTPNKTIFAGILLGLSTLTLPNIAHAQSSGIEYADGPTAKLNIADLNDIKAYSKNANTDITRLLTSVSQSVDSVEVKNNLMQGIDNVICPKDYSTDQCNNSARATLLLTHTLKAGMTIVRLIDQESVKRGLFFTPQGTVDQQVRILKQILELAAPYYESDYSFINGVLQKNEAKTNPKFVEFGVKLNQFILKMSDGVLSARASYGMIRWSLAVLANYIGDDKEIGVAYASTRYNLAKVLTSRDLNGAPIYPDLTENEAPLADVECISKIRNLKLLANQSMSEMAAVSLNKN